MSKLAIRVGLEGRTPSLRARDLSRFPTVWPRNFLVAETPS